MAESQTRQFLEQRFARGADGEYHPHQPVFGIQSGEPGQMLRLARTLRLVHWLEVLAPESVLDLGAAEGYIANLIRLRVGCPVLCSDLSLEACRRAAELYGLPAIAGDLTELPLRPGCADVVLLSEVFEHLPDPRAGLEAALRYARRYVVLTTQERCASRCEQQMRLALADPDEPHGERNWLTSADLRALFGKRVAPAPQFRRTRRRLLEHVPPEQWRRHIEWLASPRNWRTSEGIIAVIAVGGSAPPPQPPDGVDAELLDMLIAGPPAATRLDPPWGWLTGVAPPQGLTLDATEHAAELRATLSECGAAGAPTHFGPDAEGVFRQLHIPARRPSAALRRLYARLVPLAERIGFLTCDDPLPVKLSRMSRG